MATYHTEQKRMLSGLLRKNSECAYSIEDIITALKEAYGDNAPGKSTVYRLMTRLVDEGKVRRFVKGHGRSFVYQAVDSEHCHTHLHLKCVDCGRLIHLDSKLSDELVNKVRAVNDFSVSEEETILLGACSDCKRSMKKREIE